MSPEPDNRPSPLMEAMERAFKKPIQDTINELGEARDRIRTSLKKEGLEDAEIETAVLNIQVSALVLAALNHSTEAEENRRLLQVGVSLLATTTQLASVVANLKIEQARMASDLRQAVVAMAVSNEVKLGELSERLAKKPSLSSADRKALGMVRKAYRQVQEAEREQRDLDKARQQRGSPYA